MQTVPQIVPVTEMRQHHKQVLEKLHNGPVILAQRSKPTAILVSIEEWDQMVQDAQKHRRSVLLRQLAEDDNPDAWGTMEELDTGLRARGWLDDE